VPGGNASGVPETRGRVLVGTSGWAYPHWRGVFYPEGLPQAGWLPFYQRRFATVEVNTTFYHLPRESLVLRWRDLAPPGFSYAVKASRVLTHRQRLGAAAGVKVEEVRASLDLFLSRYRLLGAAAGPVLFQLPPRCPADAAVLARFLSLLPDGLPCAFEFRDPSWFADEVLAALAAAGAGFCISDLAGRETPLLVTADLVYVRLHGPRRYAGSYDDRALEAWAGRAAAWAAEGREVRVYFDNDERGFAVRDAERLLRLLGERSGAGACASP